MSNIAQANIRATHLRRAGTTVKLWPNGELSVYRAKKMKRPEPVRLPRKVYDSLGGCLVRAYGLAGACDALVRLGLSPHQNFDKPPKSLARYGLKGISGKGKRRVRNACYMMTREVGKHRLTFSTVTIPPLALGNLERAHKCWHKLIDFYRREMSRALKKEGLPGEIVGVTEIQEKRYEKTGLPVLHAHFVFVGAGRRGGWAITTAKHDHIWRRAFKAVLGVPRLDCSSACQLKSVTKSAEGYLGKYMSKGAGVVARVVADGLGDWLPRQWWNCSRSIVHRMEVNMRIFDHGIDWLLTKAENKDCDLFQFWSHVLLEREDGSSLAIASYGRLTARGNGLVRKVLNVNSSATSMCKDEEQVRFIAIA